jgi:putative transposase
MRTDFVSYSSSVGRARLHVALIPKYRHKIFGYARIKEFCAVIFREISNRYGFRIIEIGFDVDHVHMVIDLGINLSLSKAMQLLKGISSRKLLKTFPWLRSRFFWEGHVWSPAYYFDSVGDVNFETMSNYVRFQERKPKNQLNLSTYMPPTSVGGS